MNDDEDTISLDYDWGDASLHSGSEGLSQQRPIVVGYAFGPKKMQTMGMVMAEASKTKLSTTLAQENSKLMNQSCRVSHEESELMPSPMGPELTKAVLSNYDGQENSPMHQSSSPYRLPNAGNLSTSGNRVSPHRNIVITFEAQEGGGLQNIVRDFRSSCSSVADSTSTGTRTASTLSTSQRTSGTALPTLASSGGGTSSRATTATTHAIQYPARVSFVPLDPEIPLEEQHGGIDVILHKLTEDILLLSQLSVTYPQLKGVLLLDSNDAVLDSLSTHLTASEKAAIHRVYRLCEFQRRSGCSLVDNPICVLKLMSRADIADTLRDCLRNVTTTSGMTVGSPRYVVLQGTANQSRETAATDIERSVLQANLSFPLIVKPLTAAGTKASHAMAILTDPAALATIQDRTPCLCQEYANHDAILYKVYVLGDFVSVHKRRSLPNLPRNKRSRTGMIEFDSQRPYPRLSDFGFVKHGGDGLVRSDPAMVPSKIIVVTAEEVRPIAEVLKKAFGLEIFGFDVLITAPDDSHWEREMLVVDVNYFPSYKEVPNFPALLAAYLTERAIASRQQESSTAVVVSGSH